MSWVSGNAPNPRNPSLKICICSLKAVLSALTTPKAAPATPSPFPASSSTRTASSRRRHRPFGHNDLLVRQKSPIRRTRRSSNFSKGAEPWAPAPHQQQVGRNRDTYKIRIRAIVQKQYSAAHHREHPGMACLIFAGSPGAHDEICCPCLPVPSGPATTPTGQKRFAAQVSCRSPAVAVRTG